MKARCQSGDRWPLSERADDAVWVPCSRPAHHGGPHRFRWEWTHDRPMPRTTEAADAYGGPDPNEGNCQDRCPYGTACDCQELRGTDARKQTSHEAALTARFKGA